MDDFFDPETQSERAGYNGDFKKQNSNFMTSKRSNLSLSPNNQYEEAGDFQEIYSK